jgi:cobalt-zinc-cadmium resistance protein CzcA
MELRTIQDWLVAPLLKPIPGVNEINSFGGQVKQYQVVVDPAKLLKYGLTVNEVFEAVERNNTVAAGGVIVRGWEQAYLRGVGLLRDIPDIERIVLQTQGGSPVFLRDVAQVAIGAAPRQGAVTRDGKGEVVAGMVIMLKGENSRKVVSRVKEAVQKIQPTLPEGVRISVFYDRTSLIRACISTVLNALLQGGLLVILVLFLFLFELRTALIVIFSLPLTFLVTFIMMKELGLTANLMSLGGLAFSVGMVVDASIVVVENIRRHLAERGDPAMKCAIVAEAVSEVVRPVAFAALILAIILIPLFTLQGIEGKMFKPLAATMLIALLVSLLIAVFIMPVLADAFLKQIPVREFGFIRRFRAGYMRVLDCAVRRPRVTLSIAVAALAGAAVLAPLIGTEFMPSLDEGAIAINVVRLPNAALEGSIKVAEFMEKELLKFPEVSTVVSKTGRAEISEDPMGPEQTDLLIMLKPHSKWGTGRSKRELVAAISDSLSAIPGLRLSISQPIALRVNELISGVKSDLAVKLFGADLEKLKGYADKAASIISGIEGSTDVKVEQVAGMEQYEVEIDRDAIARHGINIAAVGDCIETALAGKTATLLAEDEKRFDVVIRFPESSRSRLEDVGRLLIAAPGGERVPLGQLASIRQTEAPAQISRENGMRRVVVETNIRGRDLGGFVKEAESRLSALRTELPPGYFLEYGGQFENQQRAMKQFSIVIPIALLVILLLLFMALGSIRYSLLVLLNLPFAIVGGIVAVVLFRMPLSVSASVAFIMLLGVAVQNGVVLVSFFRQLRQRGVPILETLHEGCSLRFRPLLMTALTTFIGQLPLLYATGSGADIQKPLAVVIMGGLITSTLLTLLVLPTVFYWFQTRSEKVK